jgi:hypothetical protein
MIKLELLKEILQSNLLMHIYSDKMNENYDSIIKNIYEYTHTLNKKVDITIMKENIFIKYQNQFYKIRSYSTEKGFIYIKTDFIPYEELGWLKKIYLKYKQKDIEKLILKPCYYEEINLKYRNASIKKYLYKNFIESNIMKSQIVYDTYYKKLYEINYIEFKELPARVSDISIQEEALFLAMIFERYYIIYPFVDTRSLLLSVCSDSDERIELRRKENKIRKCRRALHPDDYGSGLLDLAEIKSVFI